MPDECGHIILDDIQNSTKPRLCLKVIVNISYNVTLRVHFFSQYKVIIVLTGGSKGS